MSNSIYRRTLGSFIAGTLLTLGVVGSTLALPVLPGLVGKGSDTAAGRNGTIYKVTTLANSGTGSLRACVEASGPRICVFEVGGIIDMGDGLTIRNPNITIAGQTAPSPGIMLKNGIVLITTSDVLLQHFRIRIGDDFSKGQPAEDRDGLTIWSEASRPVKNIVVDHLSISWSTDELMSAYDYWDGVVLSNNIFSNPLNESMHPDGPHGYGPIFGGVSPGSITLIGNLFANMAERNPLSRATEMLMVNNVIYNRKDIDTNLGSVGQVVKNTLIGNVYVRGPDYTGNNKPILLGSEIPAGSKLFLQDNSAVESTNDPWSLVGLSGLQRSSLEAGVAMLIPSSFTSKSTAGNGVYNSVLALAGARPVDRDSVDKRIIQGVRDRSGRIINCVGPDGSVRCQKNDGGWPVYASTTRKLTLPGNPNAVTPSGYTTLEVYLQDLAKQIEGGTAVPLPPTILRVE